MASCSKERKRLKSKKKGKEDERVQVLKHYDTFYGQAPPGLIKEEEEHPEDCIPNLPENKEAREFLSKAPTKGLWMPLGKEVKVMKCWRCKTYGHRTGDRECPLFVTGNAQIEKFR
ncbi:Retinitis pigmentosa 9 protein, partial [Stegodyphus mimosarum]